MNPFDLAGEMPADTNPFEPRTQRELDADLYENWATNQPATPQRATIAPAGNRADSIRVIAVCEAVAKALREGLTEEARTEYDDNGTRAVYDVPSVGKIVTAIDQAGIIVDDREAWMKYARKRWPDEIVMVPSFRNPAFEKQARAAFEQLVDLVDDDAKGEILTARAAGRVLDDELTTVPGLAWTEGGTFRSASLTVDSKLKRHVADVARRYVAGAGPLQIEGGA